MNKSKHNKNMIYFISYAFGNSIMNISCKDLIFPSNNDMFFILKDILLPIEDSHTEAIYIPKQFVLGVKEYKEDNQENNKLKVVHARFDKNK